MSVEAPLPRRKQLITMRQAMQTSKPMEATRE